MVCLIGVYSTNSAPMDVLLAVMFGVFGYILQGDRACAGEADRVGAMIGRGPVSHPRHSRP